MAIIGRATTAAASGIARVYVDTWQTTYAGLLPERVLVGMSYDRQASEWAWTVRNCAHNQPIMIATEPGHGVIGFASAGLSRATSRPAAGPFAGKPAASAPAGIGEVFTLYVHPEFQDNGIGRQLLAAVFGSLCERKIKLAFLWVLAGNPSRYFYERMGGRRPYRVLFRQLNSGY
ncbi:MAG: GNAT family N-acetyltransferase [Rhodospirillales bacterium]|nr:GNAT family N-acetyltransferase [Rhodospirillales bacterium]